MPPSNLQTNPMKAFALSDLKDRAGKIVDAASREPVSLTRPGAPALVLMSQDEFDRRQSAADPRHAYGVDELPPELARDLAASLEAVTPETYGDDG